MAAFDRSSSSNEVDRLLFPQPLLLVEGIRDTESNVTSLLLREATLSILQQSIGAHRIKVCSIVGPCRSGKSYIMNGVVGHEGPRGFDLGHQEKSHTKGIWCWAALLRDQTVLVALDTEGLGDPRNPTVTEDDIKRFLLSLLLSSHLTLNVLSTLDAATIQRLSFVSNLTERIKVKTDKGIEEDGNDYKSFFPHCMFLVRDFSLGVADHDNDPDKWLMSLLERVPGKSAAIATANMTREIIRDSFPSLHCRTIVTPTLRPEEENKKLDSPEAKKVIRPEFIEQSQKVITEIRSAPLKKVKDAFVTGDMFVELVKQYVTALNDPEKVPSIPDAFDAITSVQMSSSIQIAVDQYDQEMKKNIPSFPLEEKDLLTHHEQATNSANVYLAKNVAASKLQQAQKELSNALDFRDPNTKMTVGGRLFEIANRNLQTSRTQCQETWEKLRIEFEAKIDAMQSVEAFEAEQDNFINEFRNKAIGPAKGDIETSNQEMFRNSLARLSANLKLTELQKKQAEDHLAMVEAKAEQAKALAEINRLEAERQSFEDNAKKRHDELQEQMAKEAEEHRKQVQKIQEENTTMIAKASEAHREEMKKELEIQARAQQQQFEQQRAESEQKFQRQLEDQRKRDVEALEKLQKQVQTQSASAASGGYLVPLQDRRTGKITWMPMNEQQIQQLSRDFGYRR